MVLVLTDHFDHLDFKVERLVLVVVLSILFDY